MANSRSRWSELQARIVLGEPLTATERDEWQELVALDPLHRREHSLLTELRDALRGPSDEANDRRWLQQVMSELGRQRAPWLRIVGGASRRSAGSAARAPVRRRRAWALAGCIGAAAAASALVWWPRPAALGTPVASHVGGRAQAPQASPVRAELVLASGEVFVDGQRAHVGNMVLRQGQRVGTRGGAACLTIDPGIDVCLPEQSEVQLVTTTTANSTLAVARGTAIARLSRRAPGQKFALRTPTLEAVAHGTVYALTRGERDVRLTVLEGNVRVTRDQRQSVSVAAHHQLRVESGAQRGLRVQSVSRGNEAALWARLAPAKLWRERSVGVISVAASEPWRWVRWAGSPTWQLPFEGFAPSGEQQLHVIDSRGNERTVGVSVTAGERSVVELPQEPQVAHAPPEQSSRPTTRTARALLDAARSARQKGDTAAALELYRQLRATHPASAEATTVLVTLGELELDRGRGSAALRAFERYLAQRGPLTEEALGGQARALRALGRAHAEAEALRDYLQRFPAGFSAARFRQRLESLEPR